MQCCCTILLALSDDKAMMRMDILGYFKQNEVTKSLTILHFLNGVIMQTLDFDFCNVISYIDFYSHNIFTMLAKVSVSLNDTHLYYFVHARGYKYK